MYKGVGRTWFCFFINSISMSPATTTQTVEELCAWRQAEREAEDRRRAEEDRLFEEEIRKLAEEEENQRREEEAQRR
jgi:hypothetical protein